MLWCMGKLVRNRLLVPRVYAVVEKINSIAADSFAFSYLTTTEQKMKKEGQLLLTPFNSLRTGLFRHRVTQGLKYLSFGWKSTPSKALRKC